MDSGFQQQQYQHHFQDLQTRFQHQKQEVNNLTRFRSAPSSYFANFLDAADTITNSSGTSGGNKDDLSNTNNDFFNARPLSPETENIFARFMSNMGDGNNTFPSTKLCRIPEDSHMLPESVVRVKQESDTMHQQQSQPKKSNYNTTPQMMYQSPSKPPLANQHGSASAAISAKMHSTSHMKLAVGGCDTNTTFSLTRHSSSPAGFLANLDIDGYGVLRGVDKYGGCNNGNYQVNYSSGQPSTTLGIARQNSQVEEKIKRMNSLEETKFSNNSHYTTGIPMSTRDNLIMPETMSGLDGGDEDKKFFSEHTSSNNQTGTKRSRPALLAHHLSLPNTSAELSAMEKLLNLQDVVPLRIRAKRGFATHPRSIAERVRRTKISERMRKLQDLVPNMDKQTHTADMLDLAVDYIKDLRNQVKILHDNQAKCTCPR